jgi:hypothetical protein
MSISKVGNDEAVIDLNGFVGTLRVMTKKHANPTRRTMWDFLNKGSNTSAMTTPCVNALPLLASTTTTTNENDEDLLTYDNGNMADMLQMEDTSSRIVEDTPSPTKKGYNDDEMKSDDDEKKMMTTGAKNKKKTKGQQKLSFFDSKGKKNTNKQQGSNKKVCLRLANGSCILIMSIKGNLIIIFSHSQNTPFMQMEKVSIPHNNNKRLVESEIDVADVKKSRVNNDSTDEEKVLPSMSDNVVSACNEFH